MTEHAAPQMTDANGDPEEILPGTPASTAREDAEDHTTEDTAEVLHKEAPAPAEAEADTFSRDYVEKLRQENGKYRQRAQRADDLAHRLHTAHDADRVAVMEDGRITELGSHDQLVAEGGAYARLWESWRQE